MKIVNIMNFVRRIDERMENSTERLLAFAAEELALVNEYGVDNTFLLQYDAVCDEDFVSLFKNKATDKTELGLWYEIVEPLTSACGIPYRSEKGWKWDWHIIPGFSMAYSPSQREMLIDEAMKKFKEVFGYYPKTVASWLIDTHTINYLSEHYDVSAVAICRDQANTDAYTLLGGYFNGAYYPSKNNIFTPAQSRELQTDIPVFRLLGPCPIHNYDNNKYSSEEFRELGNKSPCFTLEPCWYMGSNSEITDWLFNCYYGEESLGFAYAQIGQENSFLRKGEQVLGGIKMQIEQLIARGDVQFKKMSDTGEIFKVLYPDETPATSLVALNNFDSTDVQSVYYDCKNYTANLFRFEDRIFIRSLFLFDERTEDIYLKDSCTTYDAVYENLPIIDTRTASDETRKQSGLMIDTKGVPFTVKKVSEGVLAAEFGENSVTFYDDRIEITSDSLLWYKDAANVKMTLEEGYVSFEYKSHDYRLEIDGAKLLDTEELIRIDAIEEKIVLYPRR